jgi:hypothetical protein
MPPTEHPAGVAIRQRIADMAAEYRMLLAAAIWGWALAVFLLALLIARCV